MQAGPSGHAALLHVDLSLPFRVHGRREPPAEQLPLLRLQDGSVQVRSERQRSGPGRQLSLHSCPLPCRLMKRCCCCCILSRSRIATREEFGWRPITSSGRVKGPVQCVQIVASRASAHCYASSMAVPYWDLKGTLEAEMAEVAAGRAAAARAPFLAVTESAGPCAGGRHGLENISQLLQKQQRALLWASVQRALEAEAAEADAGNADALHAVAQKMVASCSLEAEGSQELGAMLLNLYLQAAQTGSTRGTGDLPAMAGNRGASSSSSCL